MRGIRWAIALLVVGSLALTGCTDDPLAQANRAGSGKHYIAGSGVTEVGQASRSDPVNFTGTTADGEKVAAKDYRGKVLVVNFWWANCAPCRAEASALETLNQKYSGDGVVFLGVNTRDQAATAKTFDKRFGVTYSSIMDADTGAVQLAFRGSMKPDSTPTTLVLDEKGRVAARISGPITDQPSTLDTIIRETLAEGD